MSSSLSKDLAVDLFFFFICFIECQSLEKSILFFNPRFSFLTLRGWRGQTPENHLSFEKNVLLEHSGKTVDLHICTQGWIGLFSYISPIYFFLYLMNFNSWGVFIYFIFYIPTIFAALFIDFLMDKSRCFQTCFTMDYMSSVASPVLILDMFHFPMNTRFIRHVFTIAILTHTSIGSLKTHEF